MNFEVTDPEKTRGNSRGRLSLCSPADETIRLMKAEPIAKTLEAVFRQISSAQKSHQQVMYEILNSELDKKSCGISNPGILKIRP